MVLLHEWALHGLMSTGWSYGMLRVLDIEIEDNFQNFLADDS